MKTLFVSLAVLILVFFVGCQSSITDPVEQQNTTFSAEQENYTSKDAVSVWPGTIKVDGILCEPVSNVCNTHINGVLKYNIKPIRAGHHPPTALKVGIYINAELNNESLDPNGPWRVYGLTEDIIYLTSPNDQYYVLNKEFKVSHPLGWGYKLALVFHVNETDLKLVSMELRKIASWEPIGDPGF